jgi:hypothetical protein
MEDSKGKFYLLELYRNSYSGKIQIRNPGRYAFEYKNPGKSFCGLLTARLRGIFAAYLLDKHCTYSGRNFRYTQGNSAALCYPGGPGLYTERVFICSPLAASSPLH